MGAPPVSYHHNTLTQPEGGEGELEEEEPEEDALLEDPI